MPPNPGPNDHGELIRGLRPLLVYDCQEEYRALAVDSMVDNPGNRLERNGQPIADHSGVRSRDLTLDLLTEEGGKKEDVLVQAPSPDAAARRLQANWRYANCVYGRSVPDGDRLWLQYWIWFYYRPAQLLGLGRHEGDWQLIQVGVDLETHEPCLLTVTNGIEVTEGIEGRSYGWEDVTRTSCAVPCAECCAHPRAAVELFSHAIELEEKLSNTAPQGVNGAAASPLEALPEVRDLGKWSAWPGRWGATDGRGFGRSPRGPAKQGRSWDAPATFHRKATKAAGRLQRFRARRKAWFRPAMPTIYAATVSGNEATVELSVRRSRLRRRQWVLVTVHERSRDGVLRKRVVSAGKNATRVSIPLPRTHSQHMFVHASAFNRLRRRSDVATADLVHPASAYGRPREWSPSVVRRFHHALIDHLMKHGAATVGELERQRFSVLDLALEPDEIRTVLESARRHGMVESLEQTTRVDGTSVAAQEWAPTERGRLRARRLAEVAPGVAKALPWAMFGAIGAVLAERVKGLDFLGDWLMVVSVVFAVLVLIATLGAFALRRSQGALPRVVAKEWDRHAVELPELNRWYRRPVRVLPYVAAGLLIAAGMVVIVVGDLRNSLVGEFAGMGMTMILATVPSTLYLDLRRTGALRREAIAARDWSD